MKVIGTVAEFNPFHNGHAYFVEQLRKTAGSEPVCVVAVMSGHFVQRGEPAVLPKHKRVQAALQNGVDLVLELPVPWSLASAEAFAMGGVSLLNALGVVDTVAFGSECGDVHRLCHTAEQMESPDFSQRLRALLDRGLSFPAAQEKALDEIGGTRVSSLLATPNNVLGIEYIKALKRLNSSIHPITIPRFGAEHDALTPTGDVASASYIRTLLAENRLTNALPYLPATARTVLSDAIAEGVCPADEERLQSALLCRLRQMSISDFAALPTMSEGLENRLFAAAQKAGSVAEFLSMSKTKRYPLTRLKRAMWCAFLGITEADATGTPPYIRPLGCTERGMEVLRSAKAKGCPLPILSRVTQADSLSDKGKRIWELECRAADLYALALPTPPPCGTEWTTPMVKE